MVHRNVVLIVYRVKSVLLNMIEMECRSDEHVRNIPRNDVQECPVSEHVQHMPKEIAQKCQIKGHVWNIPRETTCI